MEDDCLSLGPLDYDEEELDAAVKSLEAVMKRGEPEEQSQAADVPTEAAELPTEAAVTPSEAASLTTRAMQKVVYFPGVTCPACGAAKLKVTPFHRYDALVRHWQERHLAIARVFPCPTQGCNCGSFSQ